MTKLMAALIAAFCIVANPALAHKRHHHTQVYSHSNGPVCEFSNEGRTICGFMPQIAQIAVSEAIGATIIGGRPSGCPHAYCGCGARLYLGISDTRLNLAWNWTKYYHGSTPVAVWPHHIAIIEKMTGPGMAILRDYNSGGGLARIHERSIAGARIVSGGMASL